MPTRAKKIIFIVVVYVILVAIAIAMVFPYLWMLSTSLMTAPEAMNADFNLIPSSFQWQHYREIFDRIPFIRGTLNTSLIVIAVIPIGTIVSGFGAFSFAKLKLPFRSFFLMLLLSGTMVPYAALMLPQFQIFSMLGMRDTLWPLILPGWFGNVMMMFFFMQFLRGTPTELIEAAKIDRAGYVRIFFTLMIPLLAPAIAVQIVFWFTGIWNDFLAPSIYLTRENWMTLQVLLFNMIEGARGGGNWPLIMTASVLSSIPILVIFIAFQRFFVESVAISGIK